MLKVSALVILSYLIGSIPFSLIFGQLFGKVDIRTKGSGTIGATNVLRTSGLSVALLALVADVFKGITAAWIGTAAGGPVLAAVCAAAVVTGHCYSIFLKFKGGKGVAASAGIIAFLMPDVFGVMLLTVVVTVAVTRYMSLGSIIAAILYPLLAILIFPQPLPYIILGFFMAVLVIYKHKDNIKRLRAGNESRITDKI